ncbi:MAG: aminoacyl-tRNA hydrolase [Planctomycetota bacterium]|jgi:ribosome-associated protein|nr:aminoacyl-tRNA hydrolase [Planctomycetota bacterium]
MESEETFIAIQAGLAVPKRDVWFEFSHAAGPGGQNVNKVATAVTLCFHPDSSAALSPGQLDLLKARLANRFNAKGILRLTAADGRTQGVNRSLALARFRELLNRALTPVKRRRPTRPSRAADEKRLAGKRRLAARKTGRQAANAGDPDE